MAYTLSPAPGTISIAGNVITGIGTIFTAYRKGALIVVPGKGIGQLAETPSDDLTAALVTNWAWPTVSGLAFELYAQSEPATYSERVRQLLESLGAISGTGIQVNAVGDFADRSDFDTRDAGFTYLSLDGDGALIDRPVMFVKESAASGDWSDAIDWQAPVTKEYFDLSVFGDKLYSANELLFRYEFPSTVVFTAGLTDSLFSAETGPGSSIVLPLKKNGTGIGSINFASGATTATFTFASDVTFGAGEVLEVYGPASTDSLFAGFAGVLRGARDATGALSQSGIAVLDFGAFPGNDVATLAITGQSRIQSTSLVEAWVWPGSGTADHSPDEHLLADLRVTVSDLVAGTGFTINVYAADDLQSGQFNVAWRFS